MEVQEDTVMVSSPAFSPLGQESSASRADSRKLSRSSVQVESLKPALICPQPHVVPEVGA